MDRTARKPWLTLAFVDSVVIFPDERGWLPLNSHEMCHTFHFLCFIIPTKESQDEDEVTLSECKGDPASSAAPPAPSPPAPLRRRI